MGRIAKIWLSCLMTALIVAMALVQVGRLSAEAEQKPVVAGNQSTTSGATGVAEATTSPLQTAKPALFTPVMMTPMSTSTVAPPAMRTPIAHTPKPSPTPMTTSQLDAHIAPKGAPEDQSNVFSLIYNAYRNSALDPCGCISHQLGGIDKEARVPARLQEQGVPLVKVDGGGFMKNMPNENGKLQARHVLRALAVMKYDAINVGYPDLSAGLQFLQEEQSTHSLPLISANVVDGTSATIFAPYKVIEVKLKSGESVKVGVIGVTRSAGPQPFNAIAAADASVNPKSAYVIADPVEALKKHLPKLRKEADIIVLADYENRESASNLITKLGPDSGINIVVAGELPQLTGNALDVNGVKIVSAGFEGRQVGHMMISVRGKKIAGIANSLVEVVQSLPPVPEITRIIADYRAATQSLPSAATSISSPPGMAPPPGRITFAGATACQTCHRKEYDQWKTTKHSHAMQTLIAKSNHFNPDCLKCHTTGYKVDNGFSDYRITPHMGDIQCEVCHGPAFQHVLDKRREQIMAQMGKSAKPTQPAAPSTPLRTSFTKEFCMTCHDAQNDNRFEFNRDLQLVNHKKVAQRPENAPITQETSSTATQKHM